MDLLNDNIDFENLSSNQQSFLRHEEKVAYLETLSDLIGCTLTFPFYDGTIPDVIRIDSSQSVLYIGDAKETEGPSNRHTQQRLYSYLLWLAAFVSKPGKEGIFAICFKKASDLEGWINTLKALARTAAINVSTIKSDQVDDDTNLIWLYVSS